ncbi:hypothetical protein B0H34DRAFT_705969 [Crassisporium funariophilum]|nr:hypothetical protein B0H34DRAFT_705969 [Crassisporium funariophilum]
MSLFMDSFGQNGQLGPHGQGHPPSTPANCGPRLQLPRNMENNSLSMQQQPQYNFSDSPMYSEERMMAKRQMQRFEPEFSANPSHDVTPGRSNWMAHGELPSKRRHPTMEGYFTECDAVGTYVPRSPPPEHTFSPDWQEPLQDNSSCADLPESILRENPKQTIAKPKRCQQKQKLTTSAKKTATAAKEPEKKDKPAKTKKTDEADRRGGPAQGARNFTGRDMLVLVKIIGTRKPLGPDGWEAVAKEYNKWALKNGSLKRDKTLLRHKFDAIVKTASEKPTGEGERLELYTKALLANNEIITQSSMITLDDDASEKNGVISLSKNETESEREEEPKSRDKKSTIKGAKAEKADKSADTLLVKSYKTSDPLEVKP